MAQFPTKMVAANRLQAKNLTQNPPLPTRSDFFSSLLERIRGFGKESYHHVRSIRRFNRTRLKHA